LTTAPPRISTIVVGAVVAEPVVAGVVVEPATPGVDGVAVGGLVEVDVTGACAPAGPVGCVDEALTGEVAAGPDAATGWVGGAAGGVAVAGGVPAAGASTRVADPAL
jgi:hypothetical protein